MEWISLFTLCVFSMQMDHSTATAYACSCWTPGWQRLSSADTLLRPPLAPLSLPSLLLVSQHMILRALLRWAQTASGSRWQPQRNKSTWLHEWRQRKGVTSMLSYRNESCWQVLCILYMGIEWQGHSEWIVVNARYQIRLGKPTTTTYFDSHYTLTNTAMHVSIHTVHSGMYVCTRSTTVLNNLEYCTQHYRWI